MGFFLAPPATASRLPSISEYGAAPAHLIRHRIYELKYLVIASVLHSRPDIHLSHLRKAYRSGPIAAQLRPIHLPDVLAAAFGADCCVMAGDVPVLITTAGCGLGEGELRGASTAPSAANARTPVIAI
jgi:hypothetical protein